MSNLRKIISVGVASGWSIMCTGAVYIAGVTLGDEIVGLGVAIIGAAMIVGIGWSNF